MIERVNCRAVGAGRVGGAGPSAGFWAPVVKKTGTPAIARVAAVNNKRSQGVPRMHLYFRPESNPEMRRPGIPAGFLDRKQITETAAANLMRTESARVPDKMQVYCIKVSSAGTSFWIYP